MKQQEFEAYRNEVARLESEMRQSKERETKECRKIADESEHVLFLLKAECQRLCEENTRKRYQVKNEASDRMAAVKRREHAIRWDLQTRISNAHSTFKQRLQENQGTLFEGPLAQEGGAS